MVLYAYTSRKEMPHCVRLIDVSACMQAPYSSVLTHSLLGWYFAVAGHGEAV